MSHFEIPRDEQSARMLEQSIAALGGAPAIRQVVLNIYALGRIDGGMDQMDKRDAEFKASLKVTPA